jgi:hypothetical protein
MGCDICGGARVIRLPIRRWTSVATFNPSEVARLEEVARTYPCPECSDTVSIDRVAFLESQTLVDGFILMDRGFNEHIHRTAAYNLAETLLRNGFIQVVEQKRDDRQMTVTFQATLGVISPKIVATMEERIATRQVDVARRAAELAIEAINNWGSSYGGRDIPKDIAAKDIRNAVTKAIDERCRNGPDLRPDYSRHPPSNTGESR